MNNSVAKVCKRGSIIIALLGGIGSFVLAYLTSRNYGGYSFMLEKVETNWSSFFVTLLVYLAMSLISALVIYAIGEIIEQLTITADRNDRIIELLEASKIREEEKTSRVE